MFILLNGRVTVEYYNVFLCILFMQWSSVVEKFRIIVSLISDTAAVLFDVMT